VIKLDIAVGHAVRVEAFAGALKCTIRIVAAQLSIAAHRAHSLGEAARIIGAEVDGGVTPKFTQTWDIVQDQSAAR